jgi:hypothetical protein
MNKFKQGVIQTVNDTWQGVDALNGTSLSGETAGVYLGSRVQQISQQAYTNPGKNDGLRPDTYLQPIFNERNEVVSYERPISPALLKGLDKDTHLGRMLGVWVGRILEEEAADKANDSVVKVTKEIWDNLKGKQAADFINVADPKNKDPVVRDAWKTFGWQVKQEAEAVFGAPDTFWIRKDMVRDLTGYRSPGIRDAWTGISRWKPEVRTTVVNASTMILGTNAYKWMTKTEGFVQDAVSLVTLPPSSIQGLMSGPLQCSQMTRMMRVRDLEPRVPELAPPHRSEGCAPDHPPRRNCALTPPMKVASSCRDRAAMKAAASAPAV